MPLTVRIFKAWNTRDIARAWVNNYEVISSATPTAAAGTDLVTRLVNAEVALHGAPVQFIQATISTWAPDSKPYNPEAFITIPLSAVGGRAGAANQFLDLNVAFMVRMKAASGRTGRRFYRGVLTESDVIHGGDLRFNLDPAAAPGGDLTGMATYRTALGYLLNGDLAGNGTLGLIGRYKNAAGVFGPTIERAITAAETGGVVVNKHNHRYYDRA